MKSLYISEVKKSMRYIFENFVYPIITGLIAGYILIILSR